MADQELNSKARGYSRSAYIGADIPNDPSEYREETASEPTVTSATNHNEAAEEAASATLGDAQGSYQSRNSMEGIPAGVNSSSHYNANEETAAEIAAPVPVTLRKNQNQNVAANRETGMGATTGAGIGYVALALSILSLFVMPILFGAAGIVLGFIARGRGATGVGAWAIGIGVVSIIIGIFVLPFF